MGGGPPLLDGLGDPVAQGLRSGTRAADDLVHRLLRALARELRRPDRRLDRALDGFPHSVGHLLGWAAPGHFRAGVSHIVRAVPIHLKPAAELAERVLLPGDPHRALAVAQAMLDQPKMFNHHRGLWGYTGPARDGELLTVQATGMGGPSAAIVVEELISLGARTFIRIGTCGALDRSLQLGVVVTVERALVADGASAALGANSEVAADPELTASLRDRCEGRAVTAVSSDLFYDDREQLTEGWIARGAAVVEMEAATLFQLARRRGARAGCVLGVTDLVGAERERIGQEELADLGVRLGQIGFEALEGATRLPSGAPVPGAQAPPSA